MPPRKSGAKRAAPAKAAARPKRVVRVSGSTSRASRTKAANRRTASPPGQAMRAPKTVRRAPKSGPAGRKLGSANRKTGVKLPNVPQIGRDIGRGLSKLGESMPGANYGRKEISGAMDNAVTRAGGLQKYLKIKSR